MSILAILEAGLFVSSEPLSLDQLKKICEATEKEVLDALERMKANLQAQDRGLVLLETPEGYQLGTKPEVASSIEKMFEEEQLTSPLSQASLETLVIIATRQPVTRVEIESIRGVKADGVIDNLMKRGFIEITGRRESLGRPFLYRTTEEFLRYFGINNLAELESFFKQETEHLFTENGKDK